MQPPTRFADRRAMEVELRKAKADCRKMEQALEKKYEHIRKLEKTLNADNLAVGEVWTEEAEA
jgi:hypothetical protein